LTLVDHPAARPATLDALLAGGGNWLVRVPRYGEKRGHPIWFARDLIAEFLALPPDGAAREVVRRHVNDTRFLDLDDPGIVADIDTREDYRALTGRMA
jgi:molybdenum cofactor cytidylyltransferase